MENLVGAGGRGGGGPEQWFRALPACTKIWLGSTLVATALANLEFVKWHDLDFSGWEDVVGRGSSGRIEAWRLLTCFLYAGKFGFNAIIGIHLMTQMSGRYETMGPICTRRMHINPRVPTANTDADPAGEQQTHAQRRNVSTYYPRGETSDYAFALLFGTTGILISQMVLLPKLPTFITQNQSHRFFHRHLTFFVVYIWSKQHPRHRVNLFGISLNAAHLPFAYLLMAYVLNNGERVPVDILHGMFVGHIYFYLACVVPQVLGGGRVVLSTPIALVDLCNWLENRGALGDDRRGNDGPILVDVDGVIGG